MSGENALHCVICFEEFSLKERPPVVLPCGHTYVCLVCSKKIKRCMECREPLFWTPPPPSSKQGGGAMNNNNQINTRIGGRYGAQHQQRRGGYVNHSLPHLHHHHHPSTGGGGAPAKPQEPLPLPVPKNLVLLEQIEASERQARILKEAAAAAAKEKKTTNGTDPVLTKEVDDGGNDTSDEDDEDIPSSLATIEVTRACGTYAVRDPEGLAVLPFDPNRQNHDDEKEEEYQVKEKEIRIHPPSLLEGEEEKKEDDYHHQQHEGGGMVVAVTTQNPNEEISQPREPFTIEAGCTVQVVSVDEGVYKLARKSGYIVATVNQLVKVGGPLDASCKLEAMLETIRIKEQELQHSLNEVHQLEQGLRGKLVLEGNKQQDQQTTATSSVIAAPKLIEEDMRTANDENDASTTTTTDPAATSSSSSSSGPTTTTTTSQHPVTPTPPQHHHHPNSSNKIRNSFSSEEIPLADSSDSGEDDPVRELQVHRARLGLADGQSHRMAMAAAHNTCATALTCPSFSDKNDPYNLESPGNPGLPCYRVNDEDDFHGITLGFGFGCGTALFGDRMLETHYAANTSNIAAATTTAAAPNGACTTAPSTGDADNSLVALSFGDSVLDQDDDDDDDDDEEGDTRTVGDFSRGGATVPAMPTHTSRTPISPGRGGRSVGGGGSGGHPSSPNSPTLRGGGGSFDGVNFRTGMSGHMGLNQAFKKNTPNGVRHLPRMSEHRGMGSASRYAHYE